MGVFLRILVVKEAKQRKMNQPGNGRSGKKDAIDTVFYTALTPIYTTGKWCQRCRNFKEVMQDDKHRGEHKRRTASEGDYPL